jgi:hypothetical protein
MNLSDPENVSEIINHVNDLKSPEEIQLYIQEKLPGWLIYSLMSYSKDYPHLQENWLKICEMSNTRPQKIVLVKDIIFDDNHTLLRHFCELMTRKGYVVRRIDEFIPCKKCMSAIPTFEVYDLLKSKNIKCPESWSDHCSGCE